MDALGLLAGELGPVPTIAKVLQARIADIARWTAFDSIADTGAPTGWSRRHSRALPQKGGLTWDRMEKLADDWLPKPRILHPWPNQRFAVRHPR